MKKLILLTVALFAVAIINNASAQNSPKTAKEVPAATVSKDADKTPPTAATAAKEEGEKETKAKAKGKSGDSNCKKGDEKACCKAKNEGKKTTACCMPKEASKDED